MGNPLSKDFMDKVNDGILTTESGQLAHKVLNAGKAMSYWRSNRERIQSQVYENPNIFGALHGNIYTVYIFYVSIFIYCFHNFQCTKLNLTEQNKKSISQCNGQVKVSKIEF